MSWLIDLVTKCEDCGQRFNTLDGLIAHQTEMEGTCKHSESAPD